MWPCLLTIAATTVLSSSGYVCAESKTSSRSINQVCYLVWQRDGLGILFIRAYAVWGRKRIVAVLLSTVLVVSFSLCWPNVSAYLTRQINSAEQPARYISLQDTRVRLSVCPNTFISYLCVRAESWWFAGLVPDILFSAGCLIEYPERIAWAGLAIVFFSETGG